jgi:Bacterial Ig-like domain (group 3)/Bacterial Ig-like domain (group 1)
VRAGKRARRLGRAFVSALGVGVLAVAALPGPAAHADSTVSFTTPGESPFTVPAGVTSLHVVAIGGGGAAGNFDSGGSAGSGTTVAADIPVTPGASLFVEVGGNATGPSAGAGGGGAGSPSSGGGGGASDLRTCSVTAADCPTLGMAQDPRLVVAAGGGGGAVGGAITGGGGGGGGFGTATCNPGTPGTEGGGPVPGGGGGGGGCGGGGGGGTGTPGAQTTGPGGAGVAGAGAGAGLRGGGGGGSGFFGGGGGGSGGAGSGGGGGGGGGSSFVESGATNVSMVAATASPSVTITYAAPVSPAVSATLSTVSAVPASVPADGASTSTVTVNLVDTTNQPVAGKAVSLTPTAGTQSVITPSSAATSAQGVATFGVTDSSIESVTYTATDTTDNVVIAQAATVDFTILATTTTVSSSANPSVFGQSVTFTATVSPSDGGGSVAFSAENATITGCGAQSLTQLSGNTYQASCPTSTLAAGTHAVSAAYSGDAAYGSSAGSLAGGQVVNPAATSMLYNGQQFVSVGNPLSLGAQLSSSVSACVGGQSVAFSLDRNPLDGTPGAYPLATALAGSGGQASASVSTTGWQDGAYQVTAAFAGTTSCAGSSDTGLLTAASPGDAASGGGWYSTNGRVNFGFTVHRVPHTASTYTGQLLVMNTGKWRLKATVSSYGLVAGQGVAQGTGDLYWWNQALNGGLGDWQLAQSGVAYTIKFSPTGAKAKTQPGTLGIQINYTPVSPQLPLPNSNPQSLKGGQINMS